MQTMRHQEGTIAGQNPGCFVVAAEERVCTFDGVSVTIEIVMCDTSRGLCEFGRGAVRAHLIGTTPTDKDLTCVRSVLSDRCGTLFA